MDNKFVTTKELELIKFGITHYLSLKELERNYRFDFRFSDFGQQLVFELERSVWSEKLQNETAKVTASVNVPETPWQHFKEVHFPKWLLKRFPVKYKTVSKTETYTFKTVALYPDFVAPTYNGNKTYIHTFLDPNVKTK